MMFFQDSDDILILKISKGDNKSFEKLFSKYGPLVLGYCHKFLPGSEAEEISQEVWMRVIRFSPSYKPEGKALNWIYTIARNLCYNAFKGQREVLSNDLLDMTPLQDSEDQEGSLIKSEQIKTIMDEMDQLPLNQRTALMMFYIEERSIEEISKYLNVTISNAKVLIHRGRKSLRKEKIDEKPQIRLNK